VIRAEETLLIEDKEEKTSVWPAIALAIFAIVVAIGTLKFGLQTLTWLEAKNLASSNPWIANVPKPIEKTPPQAKPDFVKLFEFEFDCPWPGKSKVERTLTYGIARYDSGQVVVFFDPQSSLDTIGALKASSPLDYQKFANIFAGDPVDSNYGLYQAVYSVSPAQVSPLMSVGDAQRLNTLMMWKLAFGPDLSGDGPFYSLDFGSVRGFQFGDPASGRPVAVRAFDERDHQYRFIFTIANGSTAKITQEDINSAVQSVEPVPFIDR
jgi:hypothetical protein